MLFRSVPGTAHPARSRAGSLRRVSPGSRVSARSTARDSSRGSALLPRPGAAQSRPVRSRARTARASGSPPAPRSERTGRRAARTRTGADSRTARRRSAEPPDAPRFLRPRSTVRRPGSLLCSVVPPQAPESAQTLARSDRRPSSTARLVQGLRRRRAEGRPGGRPRPGCRPGCEKAPHRRTGAGPSLRGAPEGASHVGGVSPAQIT